MSYVIDTETIDTPAGEYVVNFIQHEYAEQPYDHGFVLIVNGGRDRIDIDHDDEKSAPYELHDQIRMHQRDGDSWDWGYRSGAAIVRWLTLRGKKGVTLVNRDYHSQAATADRFEHFAGVAWAPDDATYPEEYVLSALDSWQAWANGDVFGYTVTAPDGTNLDSCWGFYGFDREKNYVMEDVRASIDCDARERNRQANLVGAGFVGLI